jgi:hypothetical protein
MGWVMPRVNAIPIRRYRIDPQAVRVVLRRLSQGEGVGIYPEGERSWDASLQPFRRGTIRVLLKAGVPVIPCGVSGSYDVWPRWSKSIRRRTVRVEFGSPLRWPAMNRRQERDAMLPEAAEALRVALEALSKWPSSLRELRPLSGADPTLAGGAISSGKAGVSAAAGNPTPAGGGLSSARADGSTGAPRTRQGKGYPQPRGTVLRPGGAPPRYPEVWRSHAFPDGSGTARQGDRGRAPQHRPLSAAPSAARNRPLSAVSTAARNHPRTPTPAILDSGCSTVSAPEPASYETDLCWCNFT